MIDPDKFPQLHAIASVQVFEIDYLRHAPDNKKFRIGELCDDWFSRDMTRQDLLDLAEEIPRYVEYLEAQSRLREKESKDG